MELPCLKCGELRAVRIDPCDGETVTCTSCDEEYTVADVRAVVAAWGPILPWLDAHPARA